MMKSKIQILILMIALAIVTMAIASRGPDIDEEITIGVVTALTGDVAYWGESTAVGVRLAEADLQAEGIPVQFVIEDARLDSQMALNAAQKLVNIDEVDAIYSEFNPAAVAVSSFLSDRELVHIYNAAPVSPLTTSDYIFKSYLDYEGSCAEVVRALARDDIDRVGVLKVNLEFGDLCLDGIRSVVSDVVVVEEYNPGDTSFVTQLSRFKEREVDVVFHVAFQPETLTSLRQMHELDMDAQFVGLTETITPDIVDEYEELLEGVVVFGLPAVSDEFVVQIDEFHGGSLSNYHAAALGYIHTMQLGRGLYACAKEINCVATHIQNAQPVESVRFEGFRDRQAQFETSIELWEEGKLVGYDPDR